MRVRINFTIDLDPENYREVFDQDLTNEEIRKDIQDHTMSEVVLRLVDEGVHAKLMRHA